MKGKFHIIGVDIIYHSSPDDLKFLVSIEDIKVKFFPKYAYFEKPLMCPNNINLMQASFELNSSRLDMVILFERQNPTTSFSIRSLKIWTNCYENCQ